MVEENKGYDQIIGNVDDAPYINSLADQGASLTAMFAEEHHRSALPTSPTGARQPSVPRLDPSGVSGLTDPASPDVARRNHIATIFVGAHIKPGRYTEGKGATHVNILRVAKPNWITRQRPDCGVAPILLAAGALHMQGTLVAH